MEIVYKYHALKQMKERWIKEAEVELTLLHPDSVVGQGEKLIAIKLVDGWFVHVVFIRENDKYIVITTWKSRKWKHG